MRRDSEKGERSLATLEMTNEVTKKFGAFFGSVLKGTVVVTIGLFVANVFSYILQLVLARLLTLAEYGTFTALLSLSYIFAIPNTALSNSLIKLVSELKAKGKFGAMTGIFWSLSMGIFIFGLFVFTLLLVAKSPVAGYLNIQNPQLIVLFAIYFILLVLSIVSSAYLQGLLRFKAFAFSVVAHGAMKVIFPASLVLLGYGVGGAYIGMGLSFAFVYLLSVFLLKKNFSSYSGESFSPHYKRLAWLSVAAVLASVGTTLLNNMDVVLVKHYFDAETAGIYSALVTVGKVFLFGAGTVTVVMYPQISGIAAKGENYVGRFKQFLYMQILFVVAGVVVFSAFSEPITAVLFGYKFLPAARYLPLFSIFVGLYILVSFLIMFFIAINKLSISVIQLPVVLAQFILISLFHSSLEEIIYIDILSAGLLLILIVLYYLKYVGLRHSPGVQEAGYD
ncbi:oligosaccharide flippase family protein [candidate division WWE3 bacterium]|nr:oligosaccharide flippase family protein [candidate division WWE3 bacterium]